MKRRVFYIITSMVLVVPLLAWGDAYLKKLKLSKRYKAVYNCAIDENYWVDKTVDSVAQQEQMISVVEMTLSQEVLSKKKNQLSLDYILSKYNRFDRLAARNSVDTASNRGVIPLKKNILSFTDKGAFMGTAMQSKSTKLQTRDYKYFHNASKNLVLKLQDSAFKFKKWHSTRTDTVLNSGFELIFSYPLTWETRKEKDSLGLHCIEVAFQSPVVNYFTTNNMMTALGIKTFHKGLAGISGTMLIEQKTGRIIRFIENGSFVGNTEMETPNKKSKWPSVYRYKKHFVLDTMIKKPRKKIWGIF